MSPFLQLATAITIILLSAKAAGYLSTRLGQPSVLGELVAGLLLGPSLLNLIQLPFFSDSSLGPTVAHLGEFGVLLLMFLAGLELHPREFARNSRVASMAASFGVLLSLAAGWAVGRLSGLDQAPALYLGLAICATSVSISAQTLMELKALRSRIGLGIISSAVFDDIAVILLLSIFTSVFAGGSALGEILAIFLRILAFLLLSAAFGLWVLPRLVRFISRLHISQGMLSLALLVVLSYSLTAELVGNMASIIGAFIAGLMFSRTHEKSQFESGILSLGYGLFIPIFFVNIGLSINMRQLTLESLWLLLAIAGIAAIAKVIGAGFGSRLGGFSTREAVLLGTGMIPRGEVSLIVAAVGIKEGLINASSFSAVVGTVVVTTLITPPLLRALYSRLGKLAHLPIQSSPTTEIEKESA